MKPLKTFVRWCLTRLYNVDVRGLEHYQAAGERVLVVANHTTYLDTLLLYAFMPERLTFAVYTHVS